VTPWLQAVLAACLLLGAGAAIAALLSRARAACAYLALAVVTAASALTFWGGLWALLGPSRPFPVTLARVPTLGAGLTLAADPLSGFFLMMIAVMAFLATLYSTAYMRLYEREHLVRYYPALLLFFAGVIGIVIVRDWFFFLVCWEFMTVCSYLLVIYQREDPVSLRAGLKYLIVTHAATVCLIAAAIVLHHASASQSFSFAASAEAMASLARSSPAVLHLVLALWVIGFITKAGILPFGDWLPDAYPAAPTGATAAFAGTMTKLGVYGLLRVFVDLLPASSPAVLWGLVIALLGTASIFVGTITALAQENAKRLMSFHVIGQMGYILLGVGIGIYFLPTQPALALLGLAAGTFHLLNNVIYKSLLFFTAGSLHYRAGTLSLSRMGALASVLPVTALMAGIGSLSIAGVPPFNGFASKWLIYEAAIVGGMQFPLLLLFAVAALFISLVTLASFLKYLGTAFYGQPSAHTVSLVGERQEVPMEMQVPQVVLALCCVGFGLFPLLPLAAIFRALAPLGSVLSAVPMASVLGRSPVGLSFAPAGATVGVWNPIVALVGLAACALLSYALARSARAASRRVPVWYGGVRVPVPVGHFEAHGLYEPFRRAFERVYLATGTPRMAYPRRLAQAFDLDSWLYGPMVRAGSRAAERISRSHVGVPQWYLMWQVAGVVIVLAVLFALIR
jgi:hydrogenase-4 component B